MNTTTNIKHHWLLLLLGLVCFVPMQAQKNKLAKNRQGESMTFEEECDIFGKFRFRLLGQEFKSGEQAFICPLQLPTSIEVFHKDGLIPNFVTWSGATFSDLGPPIAIVTIDGFNNAVGGTIICEVSVEYPDKVKELKLKINLSAVSMEVKNAGSLAFDDNQKTGYPNYNTTPKPGIPWKYVNVGILEDIQVKSDPNSAYYATVLEADPDFPIRPEQLPNKGWNTVSLEPICELICGFESDLDVFNCDPSQTFLKVFAANKKNIQVRFFQVCELDDDIQVNLGPVASPDDVCIDPGADGKYDGERELYDEVQRQGKDELRIINGYNIVVAGADRKCSTEKMGTNPNGGIHTDCPSSVSQSQLDNYVSNNDILASMGVHLATVGQVATININYDLLGEDSKLEGRTEQQLIHDSPAVQNALNNGQLPIYIINDFDNDAGGRTYDDASIALKHASIGTSPAQEVILAHEVGHANGLKHPDDGRDNFTVNDSDNFMYSKVEEGRTTFGKTRRYQWERIR